MNLVSEDIPLRIFIVEDEALIVMELRGRLRALGYHVCGSAASGETALLQLPVSAADIVLLDVHLAGQLNGVETASKLREQCELPVVFLTAFSDSTLIDQAKEVVPYGFLVKPFEERELHATLQMVFYKHRLDMHLKNANSRLEKAVSERTIELARVNEQLKEKIELHKRTEETLRRSEERLSLAMYASGLGIWDWNLVTDEMYRSPKCFELTGYSDSEIRNNLQFFQSIVHPEDQPTVNRAIEDLLQGKIEYSIVEYRFLRKNGIYFWAQSIGKVIERDQRGLPVRMIGVIADIEERKSAELQLRQFNRAVESANDGIVLVDVEKEDQPITYVNPAFCEMTGYSREETIGQNCRFLSGADKDQRGAQELREAVAERRPCTVLLRNYRKDGGFLWNIVSISPICGHVGAVTYYVGILHDVTERKEAELILLQSKEELERIVNERTAALRESEERLRLFVENAPVGVAMFDRDMRYLAHSRQWQKEFHVEELNLIGRLHYDVFPDIPEQKKEIHRRCLAGFSERCDRDTVVNSNGSVEYFRWAIQPWRNSSGEIGGLVFFRETITERLLADRALIESEERFRQIATSISHIFWVFSLPDEKFLYFSPAFETIWGRKREQGAGPKAWINDIHNEDRQHVYDIYQQCVRDPNSVERTEFEFRIVRPDGDIRWLYVRGMSVRSDDHGDYRITGIAEDVTETKALESQVLQSQKLNAVGRLAGGIAHDFNNLLLVISYSCEQLLNQLSNDDPRRKNAVAISESGARAAALTRQLLAFSRKQVLDLVLVDINELIVQSEQILRGVLRNNITLTFSLSSTPTWVNADPGQLDQVLLNMILNAQDAMPEGGWLTIETSHTTAPMQNIPTNEPPSDGRYVRVRICDTGCGMSEELMSRIFEPYFTTKQAGKGTGLGLAVAHGIISQCGGFINVESSFGVGTVFDIHLPSATDEMVPDVSLCAPHQASSGTETILLVEDEPNVRHILRNELELNGYNVLEAEHGPAAIVATVRYSGHIHLLLTDIVMPEMSGHELAEALRADCPDLTVLFISAFAGNLAFLRDTLNESDSYLQKPFHTTELMMKIREVLGTRVK